MAKKLKQSAFLSSESLSKYNFLPFLSYHVTGDEKDKDNIRKEVKRAGAMFVLKNGQQLIPKGWTHFYYLGKGSLRMEYIEPSGHIRPLLVYKEGSMFHMAPVVLRHVPIGFFSALEDCEIWRIPSEALASSTAPGAYPHMAQEALRIFSSIIMTYAGALTFLGSSSFLIRFSRYLLLNIRRYGGCVFSLGLTQEECAATLGVHRATLARAVRDLKKMGIIERFTYEEVRIVNEARLVELAQI